MALVKNQENKIVVPWFNRNEWHMVYKLLYEDTNLQKKAKALDVLKIWKTRSPLLPAGVEGTYIILQVIVEHPYKNEHISYHDIQVLYSTAVMRFLNICVTHDIKQGTFFQMAKKMKIPEWIILLRHDTAHSSNLPPFELLQRASEFAYDWLYHEYWYPVSLTISDCKGNKIRTDVTEVKEKLEFLISVFECILVCKLSNCEINKVGDIPDVDSKEQILYDLKECDKFPNINDNTNLNDLLQILITYVHTFVNEIKLEKQKANQILVNIILSGDTFLCGSELADALLGGTLLQSLPSPFLRIWQRLMLTLQISETVLYGLIEITICESENDMRKQLATLWIIELSKMLYNVDNVNNIFQRKNQKNYSFISKSEILEYYHINKLDSEISTNLCKESPALLSNLDLFKKSILMRPTKYTKAFLPHLLNIVKPPLSLSSKSTILQLVDIYLGTSDSIGNDVPEKIYQPNDLENFMGEVDVEKLDEICSKRQKIEKQETETNILVSSKTDTNNLIWRKASDSLDFFNTPLGLLPWQSFEKNPTLTSLINIP